MLIKKYRKTFHGQAVLEYVLLVGIITVTLFAMMQAIKRGTQSLVKTAADELGAQSNSDQSFEDNRQGYLDFSNTAVASNSQRQMKEREGVTTVIRDEREEMATNAQTNMGFTKEDQ